MKRVSLWIAALAAAGLPTASAFAQTDTTGAAPAHLPASVHVPSPADSAKHNPQVAERDKLPIMARVLELSDEQHRLIVESVGNEGKGPDAKFGFEPQVTALVPDPDAIVLHDLPQNVIDAIPAARPYKYAMADNRILLVDPINSHMVIDIIRR